MKNRIFMILTAIAVALGTSSCFEIFEEVTFHKDGSGQLEYRFDFEQSKSMMEGMGMGDEADFAQKLKETMNEKGEGEGNSMDSLKQAMESIEGISNFKMDFKGFAMIMSYDFANVAALNQALTDNEGMGKMGGGSGVTSYTFSNNTITRTTAVSDENLEEDPSMEMAKAMMKDAKYSLIVHLPGKSKKIKNKNAKITNGKRTIVLSKNMLELLGDPASVSLKVKYKADK